MSTASLPHTYIFVQVTQGDRQSVFSECTSLPPVCSSLPLSCTLLLLWASTVEGHVLGIVPHARSLGQSRASIAVDGSRMESRLPAQALTPVREVLRRTARSCKTREAHGGVGSSSWRTTSRRMDAKGVGVSHISTQRTTMFLTES